MSQRETPEPKREAPSKGGGPNWTMIGAILTGATLVVGILVWATGLLGGRSDAPLQIEMIAPPQPPREAARSSLVVTITEHPFTMPFALMDDWREHCDRVKSQADSLVAIHARDVAAELSDLLDDACVLAEQKLSWYYSDARRRTDIGLRNEGTQMARGVSVRIPGFVTADWQLDGSEWKTVPRQPVPLLYTIEVGNLRPGESAAIIAWQAFLVIDTIAVLQETGETVIRRPQRSAD